MSKNNEADFVKEITNIEENFAKWYTDIVIKADLADYTDTKGCIAIKPYGYAIWENIQKYADEKFKKSTINYTTPKTKVLYNFFMVIILNIVIRHSYKLKMPKVK